MADVPATTESTPPAPMSNHEIRTTAPAPLWQADAPGPPGAAVEPPPCSPSGTPFAGAMATARAMTKWFPPEAPKAAEEITQAEWPPNIPVPTAERLGHDITPPWLKYDPIAQTRASGETGEAHLGKETSPAELKKIIERLSE